MQDYLEFYNKKLEELNSNAQKRRLFPAAVLPGGYAGSNGKSYINFSSNDYLGVAGDVDLKREFFSLCADELPGLGSTGSRLLGGDSLEVEALECGLADFYGKEALSFNSGYHANTGILPALTTRDSIILADNLEHASIIDGLKLCDGEFKRYRHLDYEQLEGMLAQAYKDGRQAFIVSESVFSMDGDEADIRKLVELKKRYSAVLVIDEAHSVGAMGPAGRGVCAALGVLDDVDVMIGTFGKAFGSMGAFAITNKVIKEMLINRMRSFIFSTALPPVNARWTRFVLEKMPDFEERRKKLKRLSDAVRNVVTESGYQSLGDSHIVPLIVGDNGETLKLSGKLFESGILCGAVRPPTVPKGSARLRFSMNAALDEAVPERLREALS